MERSRTLAPVTMPPCGPSSALHRTRLAAKGVPPLLEGAAEHVGAVEGHPRGLPDRAAERTLPDAFAWRASRRRSGGRFPRSGAALRHAADLSEGGQAPRSASPRRPASRPTPGPKRPASTRAARGDPDSTGAGSVIPPAHLTDPRCEAPEPPPPLVGPLAEAQRSASSCSAPAVSARPLSSDERVPLAPPSSSRVAGARALPAALLIELAGGRGAQRVGHRWGSSSRANVDTIRSSGLREVVATSACAGISGKSTFRALPLHEMRAGAPQRRHDSSARS